MSFLYELTNNNNNNNNNASLRHDHPDITMVLKQTNEAYLIDIAIPGDSRLTQKVVEKQTKYMDLRIEITRVWNCRRVFVIPIVVGALGSISKDLPSYLDKLLLPSSLIWKFQQSVLYSTTSLLHHYLTV